jgi:hypothetical protein
MPVDFIYVEMKVCIEMMTTEWINSRTLGWILKSNSNWCERSCPSGFWIWFSCYFNLMLINNYLPNVRLLSGISIVAVAVFLSTYIYLSLLIHITTKEYPQKPIYINYKVHDACRKSRNLNPIMLQYPPPPCQLIFVPKIQGVYRSGSLLTRSPRLSAVFSVRSNRPLYFHYT